MAKEYLGKTTVASLIRLIKAELSKYVKTTSMDARIPAPTAADNGKFMRVVNGKYTPIEHDFTGPQGEQGPQGEKGDPGESGKDGEDGYTPVKGVDYFDGQPGPQGEKGEPGKDGEDGYTPVKGKDYLTPEDVAQIAEAAANMVEVDTTLTQQGSAADAKVVGEELAKRAAKPLVINADNAPTTGATSTTGVPIFTIAYSPSDLKKHADAGGRVIIARFNRHYEMYEATDTTAKFRFIESSDIQVDWYHAILDTNKAVTITKTTHKSRMETTTGGVVGQIPRIKSVDSRGYPSSWEFVDVTETLPVYNGEVAEV